MKFKILKIIFVSVSLFLSNVTTAGVILSVDSVITNTMGELNCCSDNLVDMLNQQGLSSTYVSGVTDFNTFTTSGVTHSGGDASSWLSSGATSGFMVFDLGAQYNITNFVMWNGASGLDASVDGFSLTTSLVNDFSVSTFAGNFNGNQANTAANVYDMTDSFARYVRFDIVGNFGNSCCVAIGDIAFDVNVNVSSVPEPSTLAILALGMIGLASRRFNK